MRDDVQCKVVRNEPVAHRGLRLVLRFKSIRVAVLSQTMIQRANFFLKLSFIFTTRTASGLSYIAHSSD